MLLIAAGSVVEKWETRWKSTRHQPK
ncbi:hypothetical protein AVEN_106169-1, partial [Araneus ventricosus]